jgi:hypothetical protein
MIWQNMADCWRTVLASTLACALIPIVLCIAAGSAIRSPSDWPGSDMLVGFGLLSSALSILAVTMRLPLSSRCPIDNGTSDAAAMPWWKIDLDCFGIGSANSRRRCWQ